MKLHAKEYLGLEEVIKIATKAHEGQFRRDSVTPYIEHPKAVAGRVRGNELLEQVAWLHDVLEDSKLTADDLLDYGVRPDVVESVLWLTKDPKQDYFDYLRKVRDNWMACEVKIADMICNLSDDPTKRQIHKYGVGFSYLAS